MQKIGIIINAGSGNSETAVLVKDIMAAFARHDSIPDIKLVHAGAEIPDAVSHFLAAGYDSIVAAGGDGTISAVAREMVGRDAVLGVVPAGTFNHFAKDLNIPLTIEAAAAVIVQGTAVRIDVGQVNGRTFINNSSIGIYPQIVFHKENYRQFGWSKLRALVQSVTRVFSRSLYLNVKITTDHSITETRTPLIFIGNNNYNVEGFGFGGRHSLSEGLLSLSVSHYAGRMRLIGMLVLAGVGRLRRQPDFDNYPVEKAVIETERPFLRVALDGEVVVMETPLRYQIIPRALNVTIPSIT